MSGRHTDGPWMIATSCSWRRVLSDSGAHVCIPCIQQHDGHPDLYFPNGGEDGPDARLIAAAPELLNMLIKLRDAGRWYSSALEIDVYGEDRLDGEELEAELKALIDKATGAAP